MAGYKAPSILVSHSPSRQVDIEFLLGNLIGVEAGAIAVGIYEGIQLGGAAGAVDDFLEGEILKTIRGGMFSGRIGEIFFLPVQRRVISAEFVILVGLGGVDKLLLDTTYEVESKESEDAQDKDKDNDSESATADPNKSTKPSYTKQKESLVTVGANLARAMITARISHLGTVLMGATTGLDPSEILRHMSEGIFTTLTEEDENEVIRKISICEYVPATFEKINRNMRHLLSEKIPPRLDVRLTNRELPKFEMPTSRSTGKRHTKSVYLITTGEIVMDDHNKNKVDGYLVNSVYIGEKTGAASFETQKFVSKAEIDDLVKGIKLLSREDLKQRGQELAEIVVEKKMFAKLEEALKSCHLTVLHDTVTSYIPWETLSFGEQVPALEHGLSRSLKSVPSVGSLGYLSRQETNRINVLIISDPLGDLKGAQRETEQLVKKLLENKHRFSFKLIGNFTKNITKEFDTVKIPSATKNAVLHEMRSGDYDVLHYGGHAFFDPLNRDKSGLVVKDPNNEKSHHIISPRDFQGFNGLPTLAVFNGCESARVRMTSSGTAEMAKGRGKFLTKPEQVLRNVSFAEAFIIGGISQYVGTYWPVDDIAAKDFAFEFYDLLLAGFPIAEAMLKARTKILDSENNDWANYIHYGDPNFCLRLNP